METKVNTGMFDRVVRAIDSLAPGLRFFAFPSGTRVIIALHLITTTGLWQGEALNGVGEWLSFDRQLGLGKIRAAGFVEERDAVGEWWAAGMIL